MLSIPGRPGATCDGVSRRELLRVGGAGLFGLNLASLLQIEALGQTAPADASKRAGFGKAKNFIFITLQGGRSHLDIWGPKPDAPECIRGDFKTIDTKLLGVKLTEVMPYLAKVLYKPPRIRSVSYTPVGLFNHTAAI